MKTKKIIFKNGLTEKDFCRKYNVSRATYYKAKKRGYFFIKNHKTRNILPDDFYKYFIEKRYWIIKDVSNIKHISLIDADYCVGKALITSMEYPFFIENKRKFINFIFAVAKGYANDLRKWRKRRNIHNEIYLSELIYEQI